MVAGKSLTAVEPRQPLESHQFKVDGSQMVSGSVVHTVEATARSKSLRPVQVVITLKVPCVLCLTPATCRLPDVSQATRHPTNLLQLYTTSNVTDRQTLIFLQNTRFSTDAYHSRRQKFCCRGTARVEQFTGCFETDHQLRTVQATSENTFIWGIEITAHCDSWLFCVIQILLLTYLNGTLKVPRVLCQTSARLLGTSPISCNCTPAAL